MGYCIYCGAENKDENKFCHNCGARLTQSKPSHSSDKNLIERFKHQNIIIRITIILLAIYMVSFVATYSSHIFFGVPLESYYETIETNHLSEFNTLDLNGDGSINFSEVSDLTSDIAYNDLSDIFDTADKNGNGLLIGGEFDSFIYNLEKYYKDLEKQQKAENEKTKQNNENSHSSSSIPAVKSGKCPACGSDDSYMYEYYDEFGRPYYRCTVCDYMTYDEGEFYD